jgi:hypothetical protein
MIVAQTPRLTLRQFAPGVAQSLAWRYADPDVMLKEFSTIPDNELPWIFSKEYWNRGLATEAARAVVEHGFARLALPRIVAVAEPPNGASFRVMQKLGMTLQGSAHYYDRDLTMYALEARDYALIREAGAATDSNQ